MTPEDVQKLIQAGLPDCEVTVTGDGSHFDARVIGDVFEGQSMVNKQRIVYDTLGDRITSGEIHALGIKTFTHAEWEKAKHLQAS